MQEEYFAPVNAFFMSSLNCGIIGGRPKEAFYLVGVQEDSLILLDPHNTKQAIPLEDRVLMERHTEFHEPSAKKFPFNKLDPSMTFAFYLRSAADLVFDKLHAACPGAGTP